MVVFNFAANLQKTFLMKNRTKRMSNWRIWHLVLFLFFFCSCENNPLDIDVSHIEISPVKIQRFEKDFFSLRADSMENQLLGIQKKYPEFAKLFIQNIICPTGLSDSSCIPEIMRFILDKDMREAYEVCQSTFPDLAFIEKELEAVFRYHKYYFPQKNIPKVYSMMSGFNYSIVTADSAFAIGLEMYLSKDAGFYKMLQIPAYKKGFMRKEYIVSDLVRAWMMKEFPKTDKSGTLLSEMVYQGKLLYLADALMPHTHDSIKIRFTSAQLEWCKNYEANMWAYLIKNNFLYSTQLEVISKFINEAPFTTGFVKKSPGRTGVWLGWQIVRKYMKEKPDVSLLELMNQSDSQTILSQSKYKPK